MKLCSKCKIEKHFTDFYTDRTKKDSLKSSCKICCEQIKKIYSQNNIEKIKESSRTTAEKYYRNNSNNILEKNRVWQKNNLEVYKESKKKSDLKFHSNNPTYINDYRKKKRDTNNLYKLTVNVRSRLYGFLKKNQISKNNTTFELVGCNPHELKIYLEQKFNSGMSWDNQGKWHIDHIIPLSSAKTEEELYKLCHFTNLQPMWASDNIKKGAKIL
jgi:hypothetical protein